MSDILIRSMEMPKDQHTITITICHDGYTVVEYRDNGHLPKEIETYKTIPLPAGHGRLGDLDALEKELAFDYAYAAAKVCHNAPTIVPAEGGGEWSINADREETEPPKVVGFQIGKTAFLTREDAEKALEGMNDDQR